MEFSPTEIGLACILAATKAEGTWGFLPAVSLGGKRVAPRDNSIQEMVSILAQGPHGRFALLRSAETAALVTSSGGGVKQFVVTDGLPAAEAKAMRDRVLQAELHLLEGIGFHLMCFFPFSPLRGLLECLTDPRLRDDDDQGVADCDDDGKEGKSTPTPFLLAPSAPAAVFSSSAAQGMGAPASSTSMPADADAARPLLLFMTRQARSLANEYSCAWLHLATTSDLPLLHSPSLLALAALLLALQLGPPSARGTGPPATPVFGDAAVVRDEEVISHVQKVLGDVPMEEVPPPPVSSSQMVSPSSRVGVASMPAQASASTVLHERVRSLQAELKTLATTKLKSKLFKDANTKLSKCAIWRDKD